ncbi:unnamed protein product [Symbiodinium sp. CCMP2592]|nr:unnamed protein product [Symbiodinium sp. CCMP2592]
MARNWTSAFYIYLIFSCQMLPLCTSMRSEADFEDEMQARGESTDANALRSLVGLKCGEPKPTDEINWVMNPLNADLHEDLEPEVTCNSSVVESGKVTLRGEAAKVGDWISLGRSGASLVGAVLTDVAEAVADTTPVGIILTVQSGMNSHLDRNELKRKLQEARAAKDRTGESEALCLLELNMFNRKVLIASTAIGIAGLVGAIATLGTAAPIIVTVGMLLKRFVQKWNTRRREKKCAEMQEDVSSVKESDLTEKLGDCDPNQAADCDSGIVWTINPLYLALHGGGH